MVICEASTNDQIQTTSIEYPVTSIRATSIMNIAFFVDRFPYLSETFILNQVTGLLDRGHHVDIYVRRIENQPLAHSEVEHYNLLNRTFQHGHCSPAMPKNKFLRLTKALGLIATNLNGRPHPLLNSLNVLKYGKKAASLR
ncbi:MAG: hypothetical protein KAU41_00820, partial [Deltaproteobacteria bacterium]|nr:hypothetical protein [Deltaproteobacteria bacterium]